MAKAIATVIALLDHPSPKIQLRAAEILLDRGYGKPVQSIEAAVARVDMQQAHLQALQRLAGRAQ